MSQRSREKIYNCRFSKKRKVRSLCLGRKNIKFRPSWEWGMLRPCWSNPSLQSPSPGDNLQYNSN